MSESAGSHPIPAPVTHPASLRIPDHQLIRKIGGGSYGEVWLARNVLGEFRAVKVVYRDRFEHEREFEGIRKFEPISRLHDSQVDILHVGRNAPLINQGLAKQCSKSAIFPILFSTGFREALPCLQRRFLH